MADLLAYADERADALGVPRGLARALIRQESGGNPNAVSYKGARGVTQVMPGTMREMGYDPATASPEDYVDAGLKYLRRNFDQFGGWDKAVAAYHAGPGAVQKAGGIPNTSDGLSTTRDYTRNIMARAGQADGGDAPARAPAGPSLGEFLAGDGAPASRRAGLSLSEFLEAMPDTATASAPAPSGWMRRAADYGLSAVQGAIQVPQAAVGLADLAAGGRVGKTLENEGGAVGFRPQQAIDYLEGLKSPEQQAANKTVSDAFTADPEAGFMKRAVRGAAAAVQNPSTIAHSIVQSLPAMGAGGVVGRGALAAAPRMGALATGIGEGVVTAGQQAEQVRTDPANPDRLLTPTQAGIAAASGGATGLIGAFANRLAQRMGFQTAENLLTGVRADAGVQRGIVKQVLGGAAAEGFLEELPQSVQEQVASNLALGKPLEEGVDQAAVMGALSGAVMGAGAQAFHRAPAPKTAGDVIREDLQPEVGPTTRAINRGVTEAAQQADATEQAAGPVAHAPRAVDPDLLAAIGKLPEEQQQEAMQLAELGARENATGFVRQRAQNRLDLLLAPVREDAKAEGAQAGETPAGPAAEPTLAQQLEQRRIDAQAVAGGRAISTADPAQVAADAAARRQAAIAELRGPDAAPPREAGEAGVTAARQAAQPPEAPAAAPAPAEDGPPVADRLAAVESMIQHADIRTAVRQRFGAPAFTDALRQLQMLRRGDAALPEQTRSDMLTALESRLRAAVVAPAGVAPRTGSREGVVLDPAAPHAVAQYVERMRGLNTPAARFFVRDFDAGRITPADVAETLGRHPAPDALAAAAQERIERAAAAAPAAASGFEVPRSSSARPAEALHAAANEAATSPLNDRPEPTPGQIEAGNYAKGHARWQGLDLSFENPKGSERKGVDPIGKSWSVTMPAHYGYIKRTEGADGDHVDIYMGEHPDSDRVFVVDQQHADTGEWDEHKVVLGARTLDEATALYDGGFSDGKGPQRRRAVTEMSANEFKTWLREGDTKKPLAAGAAPAAESASSTEKAATLPGVATAGEDHAGASRPGDQDAALGTPSTSGEQGDTPAAKSVETPARNFEGGADAHKAEAPHDAGLASHPVAAQADGTSQRDEGANPSAGRAKPPGPQHPRQADLDAATDRFNAAVRARNAAQAAGDEAAVQRATADADRARAEMQAVRGKALVDAKRTIAEVSEQRAAVEAHELREKPLGTRLRPSEHAESRGLLWEKTGPDEWTGRGDWFQRDKTRSSAEMAKHGGLVPMAMPANAVVPPDGIPTSAEPPHPNRVTRARAARKAAAAPPEPAASAAERDEAARQRTQPGAKRRAAEAAQEAGRRDYFWPGNIVRGFGGSFDRVLSYQAPDTDGRWSVTVEKVERDGDGWKAAPGHDGRPRTHATQPTRVELRLGPVERPKPASWDDDAVLASRRPGLRALAESALDAGNENPSVELFPVPGDAIREAREKAGLDLAGYRHTVDRYAIRHTLNQHGSVAKEKARGQVAITADDIGQLAEIVAAPDMRVYGAKTPRRQDVVASIRRLEDGSVLVVEEVRTGRKTLALTSMRKYPAARDFDSIARTLLSNAPSDGGDGLILVPQPGAGNPEAAFSRTPAPADARQVEVERLVGRITSTWANAPQVVVVRDLADQRVPAAVRAENERQRAGGATGVPEAFYHRGTVYLVSAALRNDGDVARTLLHETLGHFGLRGTYGRGIGAVLDRLAILNAGKVRAKAKQYGLDFDKQSDRRIAAEEVLAEMAQTAPTLGWVRRAVAAVRAWLREHVPGYRSMMLSDDEIVSDYILPARRFVEQGEATTARRAAPTFVPAASRDEPMFSRSLGGLLNDVADAKLPAGYLAGDLFKNGAGRLHWWHKSIGTQFNLAEREPLFRRVYETTQSFLNDTSRFANEAADLAPTILPKLEGWRDIAKSPLSAEDTKALSRPVFEGTLSWVRDGQGKPVRIEAAEATAAALSTDEKAQQLFRDGKVSEAELSRWRATPLDIYDGAVRNRYEQAHLRAGVVWSDDELRSMFSATDRQIGLYREFRQATDRSLGDLAVSEMLRLGGQDLPAELREQLLTSHDHNTAATMLRDFLWQQAAEQPERARVLNDTADKAMLAAEHATNLQQRGYAPLSRFGQFSLDVVSADGERVFFGLYETAAARARAARQMRGNFHGATITQGTVSQEAHKVFAGVSPETIELFGELLGLDATGDDAKDQAFQQAIKLTTSTRSAMRRLLHRKGIAGFSEDAGRVLAGFVVSNARRTSSNLHMGELDRAVADIPKEQGQLKDQAVRLADYVKNPQEEAHAIRGLLFAQYLGGSVASAIVNASQPFTVTFPWLSQFGGVAKAGRQMAAAVRDANKRATGDHALDAALKDAAEQGIVAPQEIHQLMAQSAGRGHLISGDGTALGNAQAKAHNAFSKLSLAWGKVFSIAEQFNRRVTFIAAYRTAAAQGMADPAAFAARAVSETQFIYNKGNKPAWARGAIGATLFTFKQYSISYLELMSRMWGNGPEGKKAVLLALGVLFLMGGADGLPFAQDADDVLDGFMQHLGYNFSSKRARQQFFAGVFGEEFGRFFDKGLSGLPGVPIDVSGRMGMGNLLPGTGLAMKKADHGQDVAEIAGPIADFAKRAGKAVGQLLDADVAGAATTMQPVASRNIVKGIDMLRTDSYRDDKGRKVIDTNAAEAVLKMMGFQPATVARVQEAAGEVMQAVDFAKVVKAELAGRLAEAIVEGDAEARADVQEARRLWNERNPDTPMKLDMPAVLRRVKEMRATKAERLEKTAPKGLRATVRERFAEAGA